MKKATELGKSGNSVRISLTNIVKEHILSGGASLIKEAHEIKMKLITNMTFDFNFEYSITGYFTPTKITFVLHFKKLVERKNPDPELYSEFKKALEQIFSESRIFPVFKIIQYEQLSRTLQVKFAYIPPFSDDFTLKFSRDTLKHEFYYNYFVKLQKIFLFNYSNLKEIISEDSVIYIYRIEIIKRLYNIFDFSICEKSRHLLIKYIKMLDLIPGKRSREMAPHKKEYVYIEFGAPSSIKTIDLKYLLSNIKDFEGISSKIFLGKEKEELSVWDLWIPRQIELEAYIFNDELDRHSLILIRRSKYQQWRKKHKVSIKCEELNLLAYFMEQNYNLIWDKLDNRWIPKPPPPKEIFKINDYITLKLEDDRTNIYIKRRLFTHCKYLLFSFTKDELSDYEEINSIDEIKDKYDHSHEGHSKKIPSEVEFWGHCSNLQAWYENNYDSRLLHSNLAFPLLKELVKSGDQKAKQVFKEEIALRFESGFEKIIKFLLNEKYLFFLEFDEIEILHNNFDFSKWHISLAHQFLTQWYMIALKSKDHEKISKLEEKRMSFIHGRTNKKDTNHNFEVN